MAFSNSYLLSPSSLYKLNPVLFSARRRSAALSRFHLPIPKPRFVAVAASENGVFTSPEIAKSFDFTSEERIYNWWDSQGYFKPRIDGGGSEPPFVVTMPPPNVTGSLHMGHAMFVTLEDIMIRYNRMKGRPTLWLPGTDHAGIATQLVVERMLASEGIKRVDLGREEFAKRVWEWKEKYGGTITNQIRRLGASCDWTRERFTLDEQLSQAVIEAFNKLHEKGLIYQGSYMVNWSPNLQTAVSDLEVEYSEEPGFLYHIKYRVAGGSKSDFLTIATTRPETLFGDTAVAVNPEDERYAKYIGKSAIVPMTFGRHVPIIADKYVDKDFGTGVLKISPGHDHNDYLLARKLGLPILNVMNKDGTLNEVAGLYSGLDRFEARKKLWSELEETGLAVKKESHTSRVPRSQRGGEIIEPLVSKQWFVTMEPLAEKALEAVRKGELTIMPERFEKIYNHWLSNIKDWCISRQLWWGHRIPVWYIVGKDSEEDYIVARSNDDALKKAQQKYGKDVEIYQDPDVLDTWFSSSLWPFSTLGWPDVSAEDFKRFYPTSVLETGHDILFFWVARMVMMGIEFTGTVPFTHVYLHGLIRDSQGRKMSKSLRNVIDPLDTIKEFGTDALRFTLALGTVGQDLNLSTERLTSNKAFTNKLWNAGKFVLQNLPNPSETSAWESLLAHKFDKEEHLIGLPLPEYWVVSKLHILVDAVTNSYDKFFYNDIARELYDFFWGDFADWYIEASKAHLYQSEDKQIASISRAVLLYVYENILKMLHPFMPFVTEELWQALPNRKEALIVSPWPLTSLPRNLTTIKRFENLQALTRAIRNVRAEYSVEPAKRISASIVANSEVVQYISREKEVLALLSRLDMQSIHFTDLPPVDANQCVHLVAGEGLEAYLPLADMVDISAEVQRLTKRLSKMQTEYNALVARLSSPKKTIASPGPGILAIDESNATCGKRLASIGLENTEVNRQAYRQLLLTTPGLGQYISGSILFEETLFQSTTDGKKMVDCLCEQNIIPGIKVDKGLVPLPGSNNESWCQGLDGLASRSAEYYNQGARFAKWRTVVSIPCGPSALAVKEAAWGLARYAAISQDNGLVPIVEPEILLDGDHSIDTTLEVAERVWAEVFYYLAENNVLFEGILLKPSMVTPGADHKEKADPETIAKYTLTMLKRQVPPAVPGIMFLSGGQSEMEATLNLHAMNQSPNPWHVSFSYARALQNSVLKAWQGRPENVEAGQKALLARAKANSLAQLGKYSAEGESEDAKTGMFVKGYTY